MTAPMGPPRHGQARPTPRHGATLCQPGTAHHSYKIGRLKGWWEEGKALAFVPRSLLQPLPLLRDAPQARSSPIPWPSLANALGGQEHGVELGRSTGHSQCCARWAPAVSLYLSWLHRYLLYFSPAGLVQWREKPPPFTHSFSRPILCHLRQVNPPSVWREQEVSGHPHSWFFPCFAGLQ